MPDENKTIEAEGTPSKPDYVLDKFATESDQAKAYADAEKEMQRLRADLDKERNQFTEALTRIEAERQTPTPQPIGQDPLVQEYGKAMEDGDWGKAMMIQAAISQQATAQVLDKKFEEFKPALSAQDQAQRDVAFTMAQDKMAAKYGDQWKELEPQVYQRMRDDQRWIPTVASPEAYAMAMTELANGFVAAKIVADQEASERDRLAKLSAQGITGNTSRAPLTGDAKAAAEKEWVEVQNARTSSYSGVIGS